MQLDEQIRQHVVALPIDLKAEVLDFVLFLKQKQAKQYFNTNNEQGIIKPNQEQQQFFVESLLNPSVSGDKLKRFAQVYKEQMGL